MTEQAAALPSPVCPWCSAPLASTSATSCSSCGATLVGDADAAVPGVTAIDAAAIVRNARQPVPERRSRLLGWITGDEGPDAEAPAPPGSLEPPPPDVRREMLRMELEAEVADLQAEVGAMESDSREANRSAAGPEVAPVAGDLAEPLPTEAAAAAVDGADEDRSPA